MPGLSFSSLDPLNWQRYNLAAGVVQLPSSDPQASDMRDPLPVEKLLTNVPSITGDLYDRFSLPRQFSRFGFPCL